MIRQHPIVGDLAADAWRERLQPFAPEPSLWSRCRGIRQQESHKSSNPRRAVSGSVNFIYCQWQQNRYLALATALWRRSVFKKVLIWFLGLGFLGILGFGVLAWRPAIAPITPPAPGSFALELVAKGEALASSGYCAECHTAKGGQVFAGGYAMATPFGVIYSANITPDPQTGIGNWSEAAFARAMHEGVARDGSYLFPAFPYDHFTKYQRWRRSGAVCLSHDTSACKRAGQSKYYAVSIQYPLSASGLAIVVFPMRPLSARPDKIS